MSKPAKKTQDEPTTIRPNEWQAEVLSQRAQAIQQAQAVFDQAVARMCVENGYPANLPMRWNGEVLTEIRGPALQPE